MSARSSSAKTVRKTTASRTRGPAATSDAERGEASSDHAHGYPPPIVPKLSLSERDARWRRVRSLMARDGLDAIIALDNSSSWDQGNANIRYLSSIGGNCSFISLVFPQEGNVTALTGPVPTPEYWLQFQDWVTDIRTGFFDMTAMVIDRLRELNLDNARIGISGLGGFPRAPDGLLKVGAYEKLRAAFPSAHFVDATDLLIEVRFVKSEEEISMFRQSVGLVERALDALVKYARPRVRESSVYARLVSSMIEAGGEPFSLLLWTAGNPIPPALSFLPSRRPLDANDVIQVEIDAKWCGYLGHGAMTHWLGQPDDIDRAMVELQYELAMRCCEAMRPGVALGDLEAVCAKVGKHSAFICKPIVHSRGHGLDAPVLVYHARDERTKNWILEENSVFVVKPIVLTEDGRRKAMWGDTVVVTPNGAQRLGTRPPPLISL